MRKLILVVFVGLATLTKAQVNPQKGYVITNANDTIYGTIDYLSDDSNSKYCLFQKDDMGKYKKLSPLDIKGYRMADNGIYYVSRTFVNNDKSVQLFAECLIKGGVTLYRYYFSGDNYYGFVDTDGKEAIVLDDKLNNNLSNYTEKLRERREKVQQVGAIMKKDRAIPERIWKMDMTSGELTTIVKRYDEQYCTSDGDCVVFRYDMQKTRSVRRRFYIGAGISYASFESLRARQTGHIGSPRTGNTYGGVVPTFLVGCDFYFPRFSRSLIAQLELGYTPYRLKTTETLFEGGNPKLLIDEWACRLGVSYHFCPEAKIKPYLKGGFKFMLNSKSTEQDVVYERSSVNGRTTSSGDLEWGWEMHSGIYIGAGIDISHLRISATYNKTLDKANNGVSETGSLFLTAAYLF